MGRCSEGEQGQGEKITGSEIMAGRGSSEKRKMDDERVEESRRYK